jgi:hypothetical protein
MNFGGQMEGERRDIYFFFFMHNAFGTQSGLCRISKHPLTRLLSLYYIPSKNRYLWPSVFLIMGIMAIMGKTL